MMVLIPFVLRHYSVLGEWLSRAFLWRSLPLRRLTVENQHNRPEKARGIEKLREEVIRPR